MQTLKYENKMEMPTEEVPEGYEEFAKERNYMTKNPIKINEGDVFVFTIEEDEEKKEE